MKIMKFGGSSVKDPNMMRAVAKIINRELKASPIAVVLSAMKGVTDSLIEAAVMAESGDDEYLEIISTLHTRHLRAASDLLSPDKREPVIETLESMFADLKGILHGIQLVKECSPRSHDLVVSFGERLSCTIFAAYLSATGSASLTIDAREIIRTDNNHKNAVVVFEESFPLIRSKIEGIEGTAVITGFIASTKDGVTTTLGRNGSDYTASIIGAAMKADVIEIWTDVDGVLSADPRLVPSAFVVPEISIEEAMELSYFGAEVIHPYTMLPAVESNIPICIRNTNNPAAKGTVISNNAKPQGKAITGIASISDVAMINIQGGGMIGIPGIASRIFKALADSKVNVIMISQASSEHTICIVIRAEEAEKAVNGLAEELNDEVKTKKIQAFELQKDLEIIAIIGENMRGKAGISGKLFSSLGEAGINVRAIAQGSSERNISFVISNQDKAAALNVVHRAFLG